MKPSSAIPSLSSPGLALGVAGLAALGLAPLVGWALAGEHWLILALLGILAVLPVVARWPVISTFGLYVLLVPFDSVADLAALGGSTLTKLAGAFAGGAMLLAGLVERRFIRPPLAALWLAMFVVWSVCSTAWALSPETALDRLPTLLSLFLLYLVAVSFRPSKAEVTSLCTFLVVAGVLAASIVYVMGLDVAASSSYAPARGRLVIGERQSNPNFLGPALILPIALAIGASLSAPNRVLRWLALAAAAIIGVGIYSSMSRGALAALLVTTAVFVYRLRIRRRLLLPLIILAALAVSMPAEFHERIQAVLHGEEVTGSGRTEIWRVGIRALSEYGLFGAGLDNFPRVHARYVTEGPVAEAVGAHNSYLMVAVELGAIGLIALLAALRSHLLSARLAHSHGSTMAALLPVEAALYGLLVVNMFGDYLYEKILWLTLILLVWANTSRGELVRPPEG